MSHSSRDPFDEMADWSIGCFFGLIGFIVSALIAGTVGLFMHQRDKVRLPNQLEQGLPVTKSDGQLLLGSNTLVPVAAFYVVAGIFFVVGVVLGRGDASLVALVLVIGATGLALTPTILKQRAASATSKADSPENTAPQLESPDGDTQLATTSEQAAPPTLRYIVRLPANSAWQPEVAQRFVEHLIHNFPHLMLRIAAEHNSIQWEIVDWRTGLNPREIQAAVASYYPDAEVTWEEGEPERAYPFYRYVIHFQHAVDFVWPIKRVADLKKFDPLVAITQAAAGLEPGERIIYTLMLSEAASYAYKEGEKLITVRRIHPLQFMSAAGTGEAIGTALSGYTHDERYREIDQREAREKLNSPLIQCFLLVQVDSPSPERLLELIGIDAQVWQFENSPYNALVWNQEDIGEAVRFIETPAEDERYTPVSIYKRWMTNASHRWKVCRLILSTTEIASLWHLPHEAFRASGIQWVRGKRIAAPTAIRENEQGVLLGVNEHANNQATVVLPYRDRQAHMYLVGGTGVGKSTLLHRIIHQDIQAGKGVGVIDPHGRLVRNILRSSIPPEREDDVVILDVANTDYPPPLNPFALPEGVPREVAISHILGVLKKIYADDWSQTRMESAVYSALVALLYDEQATPRDMARIFLDPVYRYQLLQKVDDAAALDYWYEYNYLSPGVQKQTREPVFNRIRIFYRNAAVRNMVCHPHQLDFRRIMGEGKIFLATLNSDETAPERANLGALLMTNFQLAAFANSEGDSRFYLCVDEVQQFVTTALPEILSEARKFGLSLTVANQYLGQLRGNTLEALLSNVGTMVTFACSPKDATALAPFVRPEFVTDDLVNFDRFQAAVRMQIHDRTMRPFSMNTLPPIEVPDDADERVARLYNKSIANYTPWSKAEVEQWGRERYPRPELQPVAEVTYYD